MLRTIGMIALVAVLAFLFILDLSYTPRQKFGSCRIEDDREIVVGNCVPYCPPRPSECG